MKGKRPVAQMTHPPSPADLVQEARRNPELVTAMSALDAISPYLPQMNQPLAPNVTFATSTNQ